MKNKTTIVSIGLLIILGIMLIVPVKADTKFITITDRDAWVDDGINADGTSNTLIIGNTGYNTESYIHFNTTSRPASWEFAYLVLNVTYVSNPFNASIYNITDHSWTEGGITWGNAPPTQAFIVKIKISAVGMYIVDVSAFIIGNDTSICIYNSDIGNFEYAYLCSRENTFNSSYASKIVWAPPDLDIGSFETLLFLSGILGISIIIILRRKNLKTKS